MYANGKGVPQDLVRAHAWGTIAQRGGSGDAAKLLKDLRRALSTEQTEEAKKLAVELCEKYCKD